MTLFEDWPHTWFGLWKSTDDDPTQVPLFEEVVDTGWNPPDLAEILAYLRDCPVAIASVPLSEPCPMCGEVLSELTAQRSDGVWVWPAVLEHYVSRHHVRLPDRMVERIRGRRHRVPTSGAGSNGAAG